MWVDLAASVCLECTFQPPASVAALNDIEVALGVALPPALRDLLLESNGIQDAYGNGVMSAEEILNWNLWARSEVEQDDLYMPFDHILAFGEAGNGDMFFFPIQGNKRINNLDVFQWDHETDSRTWVANSLQAFVEQWYSGKLL